MIVIKGAPRPNVGKLIVEMILSRAGVDSWVEAETLSSFCVR